MRNPIPPIKPRVSQYGIDPKHVKKRMSEFPGITSLMVKDLFADTPDVIYPGEGGIEAVRTACQRSTCKCRYGP